eukprot:CAMPEP_0179901536 /NCGR_PEP_ID=MMETSP0982-20121206/39879_1 /TAXON_ID=483367 /ORGANISM="non described non described, Strain CCMP 2436" /LENGTH=33 /DNA_ID= /DNA_START= /DNA_END= /DNA_ORIENTATION=
MPVIAPALSDPTVAMLAVSALELPPPVLLLLLP